LGSLQILVVSIARQIFNFQRSDFFEILHFTATSKTPKINVSDRQKQSPSVSSVVMVGLDRLELSTSPLSGVRSSHLSYRPELRSKDRGPSLRMRALTAAQTGGAGRDRTGDLLNANQALSQLSYSPSTIGLSPPLYIWE
jgi:hypothetical protein